MDSTDLLESVRARIVPMFQFMVDTYRDRVPPGHPVIVDLPGQRTIGFELDPSYSLYLVDEGGNLFADFYYRSSRWDSRSSASREKFGGAPHADRRPLPSDPSDQALRNLLAELITRYNYQQSLIHITDT